MDEDEEDESAALVTLANAIKDNSVLLQKAIVRKNKALQTLGRADNDIAVYSGAIMALEDVVRRLRAAEEKRGATPVPAPPQAPPPQQMYITLSGEIPLPESDNFQSTSDPLRLIRR